MPTVFISYSHDSPEHSERLLELANALRGHHGVDAELDQYHLRPGVRSNCARRTPSSSCSSAPSGIASASKKKAAADEARGGYWEGAIIYHYLYLRGEHALFYLSSAITN